jgi:hypothetical protein
MSESRGRDRTRLRGCTGCTAAAIVVACMLFVLTAYAGRYVYRSSPRLLEGLSSQHQPPAAYSLSPDQQAVVAERGYPAGFSILFYAAPKDDPTGLPTRHETWSYPAAGEDLVFLNGTLVETSEITEPEGDLVPAPYRPEQFLAGMSFQQVVDATGLDTAVVIPLEPELVSAGEVYFAEQLILGLKGRRVQYVEALPLAQGG